MIYKSDYIDTEKYHESVTVYCGSAAGTSAISCDWLVIFLGHLF